MKTPKLQRGDRIQIRTPIFIVKGQVLTAQNYGTDDKPDWYIELNADEIGYVYWKQSLDGGSVTKL